MAVAPDITTSRDHLRKKRMKKWYLLFAYQRDRQRLARGAGTTTSGTPVVTGCTIVMTGAMEIVPVGTVFVVAG
jgi:hypothetical protein